MDGNYISLMDQQAVSQMIQQQPSKASGTINQYVITKTYDYNNVELQTLMNNQSLTIYTKTPFTQWLTFEFLRKEKLLKIIGQLYSIDQRTYSIECQYLDSKQQWVPNFNVFLEGQLKQTIFPPITAYGIRFRGKNNIDDNLLFTSLNIFAKANRPYFLGQNPWDNAIYLHDKYEIVNIMNQQPFYSKIDNLVFSCKRPAVSVQFNKSTYSIDEIIDNKNQDIYLWCQYPQWLTFEFNKKYKLSKIEMFLYIKDRRLHDYEIEVMDKKKNWRLVNAGKSGFGPIEIEFKQFFSSYGIRMRGKSTKYDIFVVVQLKIFAQSGKPNELGLK